MNCKEFENKLIFYIEGSLPDNETANMKSHLNDCNTCKTLHEKMSAALTLIDQDKITETNPFFFNRLTEQLEKNNQKSKLKTKDFYLQVVSYAAAIAIAVVLGIGLGRTTELNNDIAFDNETELSEYQIFADSYNMNQPTEDSYEMELKEFDETQKDINK